MATVVFFLTLWAVCKALKALFRPRTKRTKAAPRQTRTVSPVAAVMALQEQREDIETALNWIDDLISTEENPARVLQWMEKRQRLKGQLATVETKIAKLTG